MPEVSSAGRDQGQEMLSLLCPSFFVRIVSALNRVPALAAGVNVITSHETDLHFNATTLLATGDLFL